MTIKLTVPEKWDGPEDDPEAFWEAAGVCAACSNPNECCDEKECILSRPEHGDLA